MFFSFSFDHSAVRQRLSLIFRPSRRFFVYQIVDPSKSHPRNDLTFAQMAAASSALLLVIYDIGNEYLAQGYFALELLIELVVILQEQINEVVTVDSANHRCP